VIWGFLLCTYPKKENSAGRWVPCLLSMLLCMWYSSSSSSSSSQNHVVNMHQISSSLIHHLVSWLFCIPNETHISCFNSLGPTKRLFLSLFLVLSCLLFCFVLFLFFSVWWNFLYLPSFLP
jgi:hypothetical protein